MNLNLISDQIAEAANEAISEALEGARISSYDIDTDYIESIIEEAVEERLEEAVEAALKERKAEVPFTVSELSYIRSGVHSLRMNAINEAVVKRHTALQFGINMDTDEWKTFETEEKDRMDTLYEKLSEMINQAIVGRNK